MEAGPEIGAVAKPSERVPKVVEPKAPAPVKQEEQKKAPAKELTKEESERNLLSGEIDAERRKKSILIESVRRYRQRLAYKLAEQEATKKLSEMSQKSTKNIGFLRRRKERLEFRIATEAYTLEAEKDLIRKKSEVDAELEEAIKSYRLRRKAEYIANDIAELTKRIDDTSEQLKGIELKLDDLYSRLRRMNATERRRPGPMVRHPIQEKKPMEISLADIAVIKDRKEDKPKDSGA